MDAFKVSHVFPPRLSNLAFGRPSQDQVVLDLVFKNFANLALHFLDVSLVYLRHLRFKVSFLIKIKTCWHLGEGLNDALGLRTHRTFHLVVSL